MKKKEKPPFIPSTTSTINTMITRANTLSIVAICISSMSLSLNTILSTVIPRRVRVIVPVEEVVSDDSSQVADTTIIVEP